MNHLIPMLGMQNRSSWFDFENSQSWIWMDCSVSWEKRVVFSAMSQ